MCETNENVNTIYEQKLLHIRHKRQTKLDRGRCLIDVCRETVDEINKIIHWKKVELLKCQINNQTKSQTDSRIK